MEALAALGHCRHLARLQLEDGAVQRGRKFTLGEESEQSSQIRRGSVFALRHDLIPGATVDQSREQALRGALLQEALTGRGLGADPAQCVRNKTEPPRTKDGLGQCRIDRDPAPQPLLPVDGKQRFPAVKPGGLLHGFGPQKRVARRRALGEGGRRHPVAGQLVHDRRVERERLGEHEQLGKTLFGQGPLTRPRCHSPIREVGAPRQAHEHRQQTTTGAPPDPPAPAHCLVYRTTTVTVSLTGGSSGM